jgi:hypothetical protein
MNVYACIAAVSAEIAQSGIAKTRTNAQQGYQFRGIDDVFNALAPLLAKHGLVIIPRILSRELIERETKNGGTLFSVTVEAEFDFVAVKDGSKVTARSYGEAMDTADKATNKAMSAAYKYTAFQTFCIPTEGDNDPDASHHDVATQPTPEPVHPGDLRVTLAKIAKRGQSQKGPWTLYAVKLSDGREATTFSESMFKAAQDAARAGYAVDAHIDGKNLVELLPLRQVGA